MWLGWVRFGRAAKAGEEATGLDWTGHPVPVFTWPRRCAGLGLVVALSFNPPNQRGALYARSSAVRGRFASDRAQRSAVQGLERGSGRQGAPCEWGISSAAPGQARSRSRLLIPLARPPPARFPRFLFSFASNLFLLVSSFTTLARRRRRFCYASTYHRHRAKWLGLASEQ